MPQPWELVVLDGADAYPGDLPDETIVFDMASAAPDFDIYDGGAWLPTTDPPGVADLTWEDSADFESAFSEVAKNRAGYTSDFTAAEYCVFRYWKPDAGAGAITRWIRRTAHDGRVGIVDSWSGVSKYVRASADDSLDVLRPGGGGDMAATGIAAAIADADSFAAARYWAIPGAAAGRDVPPFGSQTRAAPLTVWADFSRPPEIIEGGDLSLISGAVSDGPQSIRLFRTAFDDRIFGYKIARFKGRKYNIDGVEEIARRRVLEISVSLPDRRSS